MYSEYWPQFYTATIYKWQTLLADDKHKDIIIDSLKFLVTEKRIELNAFVIMSNHIHLIWQGNKMNSLKHTQLSFMKYTAQQIKFDLEKHHPNVLPYFVVDAKEIGRASCRERV